MGKHLKRIQRQLQARQKACMEARVEAVRKNSKLAPVIDLAFKMPGSRKLSKK
jgi:hypothetical protein